MLYSLTSFYPLLPPLAYTTAVLFGAKGRLNPGDSVSDSSRNCSEEVGCIEVLQEGQVVGSTTRLLMLNKPGFPS